MLNICTANQTTNKIFHSSIHVISHKHHVNTHQLSFILISNSSF